MKLIVFSTLAAGGAVLATSAAAPAAAPAFDGACAAAPAPSAAGAAVSAGRSFSFALLISFSPTLRLGLSRLPGENVRTSDSFVFAACGAPIAHARPHRRL
jgi:hypothetical protein